MSRISPSFSPLAARSTFAGLVLLVASLALVSSPTAGVPASPTQITFKGATDPTASPDGQWVAYRSSVGIERIRLSNADVETLFVGNAFEPDWSAANGLVLIRSQSSPVGLLTVDPETKAVQLVTATGFDDGAVWSPLGNEIVAQNSSPDGLVLITYPGGLSSPVPCLEPDQTPCSGESPTMSTDGQWIAFDDGRIEKVSRSGGEAEYVTTGLGAYPAWSPDGKWIAFSLANGPQTESHIWVVDARGSPFGVVQLTVGAVADRRPAWSPQSDAIYFQSDRSGQVEVWRVAFDSSVPVRPTTWGRLKAERR